MTMQQQQPTQPQLRQLANILARRRGLILAIGVFGATFAAAAGLMIPARYTAKAQIVIEAQQPTAIAGTPGAGDAMNELAIETHVTMIASRDHLRHVRDSVLARPYVRAAVPDVEFEPLAIPDAAATEEFSDPPATEMLTLDELQQGLKVFQERTSRVIGVMFTSMDPEKAAAVANQIAMLYVEMQADRKRVERSSATIEQQLAELNHQLVVTKSDLAERQARLAALRELQRHADGPDAGIETLESPALTELHRSQAAPLRSQAEFATTSDTTNPELHSIAVPPQELREIDRDVNLLERETEIAAQRVRFLQQRLGTMQIARSEARQPEARLLGPEQEVAASGQFFRTLLRSQQKLRGQPAISAGARLLTVADVPSQPSSPNPIFFVFPALIVAAMAGGLLAAVLEGLDRRLRSERDIGDALGISCVGLVPQLRRLWTLPMHQYLHQRPFAAYTEAIRSVVVAALQLAAPDGAPKVFLVTSSLPGEGKTALAVSFAVYAARLQRRVLLVDLAFRHPAVLRALGGKAEKNVLDVLRGHPLEEAIQHIPDLALDYLALPGYPVDPLALFDGKQIPDLLHRLRKMYDCVVIDSAPLLGTTETRLLASMVDKVLFAVKWGSTRREVAQNAISLLRNPYCIERDPSEFVSAVITQVNLKEHAAYRYGDVAETLLRNRIHAHRAAGRQPMRVVRQEPPEAHAQDHQSLNGVRSTSDDPVESGPRIRAPMAPRRGVDDRSRNRVPRHAAT